MGELVTQFHVFQERVGDGDSNQRCWCPLGRSHDLLMTGRPLPKYLEDPEFEVIRQKYARMAEEEIAQRNREKGLKLSIPTDKRIESILGQLETLQLELLQDDDPTMGELLNPACDALGTAHAESLRRKP